MRLIIFSLSLFITCNSYSMGLRCADIFQSSTKATLDEKAIDEYKESQLNFERAVKRKTLDLEHLLFDSTDLTNYIGLKQKLKKISLGKVSDYSAASTVARKFDLYSSFRKISLFREASNFDILWYLKFLDQSYNSTTTSIKVYSQDFSIRLLWIFAYRKSTLIGNNVASSSIFKLDELSYSNKTTSKILELDQTVSTRIFAGKILSTKELDSLIKEFTVINKTDLHQLNSL